MGNPAENSHCISLNEARMQNERKNQLSTKLNALRVFAVFIPPRVHSLFALSLIM